MESVISEFGEYGLEEVAKEFASSARELEKEYILPKMVGGSKFHLLLGVKYTRIQPTLLRVLSLGIWVYLSPFKDVWGSRIIFAGPSKFFTQANQGQQRETVLAVYSLRLDCLNKSEKTNIIGEFRSESVNKVKISSKISFDMPRCENIIKTTNLISSGSSAELAKVMVRAYSDHKYIGVNNQSIRLGSGTKIDNFRIS